MKQRTEHAGNGQARSHFELIDFPDSNPYPPIEVALPDRARHASSFSFNIMFRTFVIGVVVCVQTGGDLAAHENPAGDIHPALLVRDDRLFLFYTKNPHFITEHDQAVRHRRVLDREFKVLSDAPFEEQEDLAMRSLCAFEKGNWFFLHDELNGDPNAEFARFLISKYGADGRSNRFMLEGAGSLGISTGLDVTETQIVVVANEQSVFFDPFGRPREGWDELGALMVVTFSRDTRSELARVSLGIPSRVVGLTPTSSAPVVLGGSVYVGWIRKPLEKDDEGSRAAVISEWDLGTSDVRHHVVDEGVAWNTDVALCVFQDQIVIAYSDTVPDSDEVGIELHKLRLAKPNANRAEQGTDDQLPARAESKAE